MESQMLLMTPLSVKMENNPPLLEKAENDCESHSRGPAGQGSVRTS